MNDKLDLSRLALQRDAGSGERRRAGPAGRWIARYLVPAGILLGFVVLLGSAAGPRLLPRRSVTVIPVIVKRTDVQPAGAAMFQAPGWVEPRPTPVNVPALAPGVIEELFIVEGESLSAGQPVARLIDVDAQLEVEQAQARLAIREAELERAVVERDGARTRFENPVHLEASWAEAESKLADARAELDRLPRLIDKAKAELDYAMQSLAGKQSAGAAVSGLALERARADQAAAAANLAELQGREANLRNSVAALERNVRAVRKQLELLIEEKRQVEAAEAKVKIAAAVRDEAGLALRQAELALQRMVVRAPRAGKVLRLVAAPGDRVAGINATGEQKSSIVIQMYDPGQLQVRADVRLEDVPSIEPGQPVEIETASSRSTMRGRVLLPTSSANIQKNTLEVKVELLDPPSTVTPEMLVTATFLAPHASAPDAPPALREILFAPRELLQETEQGPAVWVVDPAGAAVLRRVEVGGHSEGELVEIASGLDVTDKLVASGWDQLQPGDRVAISGDDTRFGLSARTP